MTARLFLVAIVMAMTSVAAWSQTFSYTVNARVDTSDLDVREILALWLAYLGSTPDSAYDNPHWNSREKSLYGHKAFDFAGSHLFATIPAASLVASYKPTVLSIERVGDHFEIRTLFYGEGLPAEMASSNPVTILRVAAVREGDAWKLANMLPFATSTWIERIVGPITYVMPPDYPFNEATALRARRFVDSVASMFGVAPHPFRYYLASSVDEVGTLLGHDYFFVGITTGVVIGDNRIIVTGFGSEHYPHEFAHVVLGSVANPMISEGIATWVGGSGRLDYAQSLERLRECLRGEPGVTFGAILRSEWGWHCNAFYTTGALLADLAFSKGGLDAVKHLMNAPAEDAAFEEFLAKAFGVRTEGLSDFVLKSLTVAPARREGTD